MTCVAVTGAAGYIGGVLLPHLLSAPHVRRVVAIDRRPLNRTAPQLTYVRADVRDPSIRDVLSGCDVLIHLAFIVQATHDLDRMYDINVRGSTNVFRAAADAGIHHIVNLSSYTVYGAWPDNPPYLTEEAPLRPVPGHHYAFHKVLAEAAANEVATTHPHLRVTHLRGAVVVGPRCTNSLGKALREAPFLPVFWRAPSNLQLIHEEDMARAIYAAVEHRIPGVFNIGGRGRLPWPEIVRTAGRRGIPLPAWLWLAVLRLAWTLHAPGTASPGELALLRYPLAVDWQKAQKHLYWSPRYTTRDAVLSLRGTSG